MRSALVFVIAALALALPSAGSAAPPSNDAFASATVISSLPFDDSSSLEDASVEPGEQHICTFKTRSLWYRIGPSIQQPVTVTVSGAVGTLFRDFGGGVGNLNFEGCIFGSQTVLLQPSGTYYVQIADSSSGPAPVQIDVEAVPPPANDAFADAKDIAALPYSDVVPMLAATVEADEPPATASFFGTAWWAYEANSSGPLLVQESNCCGEVHVYTGNSLAALEEVAGTRSFGRLILQATAGTTYLLQVGHNGNICCGGLLGLSLSEAPSISTAAMYSPFDPNSYDTIQFSAQVFDPAAFPIESVRWDFGDGGTAEGSGASHRYLADGDYVVRMTARMVDGRTGTSSTTITVRTHDVSITKLVVPQTAQAGKSKTITVELRTAHYAENITLQLWRSVPGGYEQVATSTQLIAAGKKGTSVVLSYTFRADDKAVGKVTFKATATINGARDALPADNEIVALPTKVN